MKLTIESWSYQNIKAEIKDFTHVEKVKLAVFCAEKVIGVFESHYPDDKRPRLAIEAAKEFIKNPTEGNKEKCKYAAAAYAAYAAYAADAAAYADATSCINRDGLKQEIIDYIKSIKANASEKPVYTYELMVRGGVNVPEQYEPVVKVFSGDKFSVYKNESGKEYVRKNSEAKFRKIDTRTDKEKLIDEMEDVITKHCDNTGTLRGLPLAFLERYDITPK